MKIRRLLEKIQTGEKGFTLIELLVVVAILGILAAVIILNVMGMMGTGTVQAANTEAHNVQIAVLAAMVDNDVFAIDADCSVGPGRTVAVAAGTVNLEAAVLANMTGSLEAEYLLNTDGSIANVGTNDGKWSALSYTAGVGWAE